LFCRSSSMMDKQMLADVYLNADGMNPFTHDAMDAINNLTATIMAFAKCVPLTVVLNCLNLDLDIAFASALV